MVNATNTTIVLESHGGMLVTFAGRLAGRWQCPKPPPPKMLSDAFLPPRDLCVPGSVSRTKMSKAFTNLSMALSSRPITFTEMNLMDAPERTAFTLMNGVWANGLMKFAQENFISYVNVKKVGLYIN